MTQKLKQSIWGVQVKESPGWSPREEIVESWSPGEGERKCGAQWRNMFNLCFWRRSPEKKLVRLSVINTKFNWKKNICYRENQLWQIYRKQVIWMCRINWWYSCFYFRPEIPFLGKFAPKIQYYLLKTKF